MDHNRQARTTLPLPRWERAGERVKAIRSPLPPEGSISANPIPHLASHPQGVRRRVPRCYAATLSQPLKGEEQDKLALMPEGGGRNAMRSRGFTLIEMIVVIVLTSIIASAVAVFIKLPVEGYVATARRAEMTDIADTAIRRMGRDLRLALPNSVRVTDGGATIEILLTKTGGRYRTEIGRAHV